MVIAAAAIAIYLNRDVCPAYERAPIDVEFMKGLAKAPDGWTPLIAFDRPDQIDVEGYHDVDEFGRAYGRAFLSMIPGGEILHDKAGEGASLLGCLTHEAGEMALDVLANAYQDGPLIDLSSGHSYAQAAVEIADPTQALAYSISVNGETVDASDFVFPAWFNRRAVGQPVDKMGALKVPLSLAPGGYAIVRDTSTDAQVFARLLGRTLRASPQPLKVYHHTTPPTFWREAMKAAPGGRTAKRLLTG